ncbi:nuclear transport factor 2 family protein [Dasania marina]|uniref:nuclear transport factor 2 family protein n=1 Tax=Dasania marina TaxID=471499 RepID=UPI0030DC19E1
MSKDFNAICELAQKYFDALYNGDADLFAEIFHPQAGLFCNNNNQFVTMTVADYLGLVRGRTNPVDRNEKRNDEILAVIQDTPTTAILRTREVFLPKLFTDELTLMKFGSDWKIVAKIWDFELIN